MVVIKKPKKIKTLRNAVLNILDSYVYGLIDFLEDEVEFEKCIDFLVQELNKLMLVKSLIYTNPKRIRKLKKILLKIEHSYQIYDKVEEISAIFGLNL